MTCRQWFISMLSACCLGVLHHPVQALTLTSGDFAPDGTLPAAHTCDGVGDSPSLRWGDLPTGTRSLVLLMSTQPRDGGTKWNWVLYNLPAVAQALPRNTTGGGTTGIGSDGPSASYQPPCSQGPGAKWYTFTLYALDQPLTPATTRVTGSVMDQTLAALNTTGHVLATATLRVQYTRTGNTQNTARVQTDRGQTRTDSRIDSRTDSGADNRARNTVNPPRTSNDAALSAANPALPAAAAEQACTHLRSAFTSSRSGMASVRCDDRYAYISSNGLPLHAMMHGITASNLQVPLAQEFAGDRAWRIPLSPTLAERPTDVTDGPIGIAINGVPIFNPCKQGGCTKGDTKVLGELDDCNGHAGRADDYHYHAAPTCLMATQAANYWDTHPVGYALDGFAIFGFNAADGTPATRDACGGAVDTQEAAPGNYSYHLTSKPPYVVGCLSGIPSPDLAMQSSKYQPLRKPPVQPFAVRDMQLTTLTDGKQSLQLTAPRAFVSTSNGEDRYTNAAGHYQIRYAAIVGDALLALLQQPQHRGKSACWRFEFRQGEQQSQPDAVYCR